MFHPIEMYFYGFFQTVNKLSKNLITLPTFSANKSQVFLRAENFKISVLCGKKIGSSIIWLFEAQVEFKNSYS